MSTLYDQARIQDIAERKAQAMKVRDWGLVNSIDRECRAMTPEDRKERDRILREVY